MSKHCMQRRESERKRLSKKYKKKRDALRVIVRSLNVSLEEKEQAQKGLQTLPRDSAPCRHRRRCRITGRAHGVYRKFDMCRNMIREFAMKGMIPGLHKASW